MLFSSSMQRQYTGYTPNTTPVPSWYYYTEGLPNGFMDTSLISPTNGGRNRLRSASEHRQRLYLRKNSKSDMGVAAPTVDSTVDDDVIERNTTPKKHKLMRKRSRSDAQLCNQQTARQRKQLSLDVTQAMSSKSSSQSRRSSADDGKDDGTNMSNHKGSMPSVIKIVVCDEDDVQLDQYLVRRPMAIKQALMGRRSISIDSPTAERYPAATTTTTVRPTSKLVRKRSSMRRHREWQSLEDALEGMDESDVHQQMMNREKMAAEAAKNKTAIEKLRLKLKKLAWSSSKQQTMA